MARSSSNRRSGGSLRRGPSCRLQRFQYSSLNSKPSASAVSVAIARGGRDLVAGAVGCACLTRRSLDAAIDPGRHRLLHQRGAGPQPLRVDNDTCSGAVAGKLCRHPDRPSHRHFLGFRIAAAGVVPASRQARACLHILGIAVALSVGLVAAHVTLRLRDHEPFEFWGSFLAVTAVSALLGRDRGTLIGAMTAVAFRDPLTGLCQRDLFHELAEHQLEVIRRDHGTLAVLALDVDNMKAVNDHFGHAAGGIDGVQAEQVACRLLGAINHSSELQRWPAITAPSLSIGLALYPDDGATLQELLDVADTALLQAKAQGKNRQMRGGTWVPCAT
ncbi:MAG: GGDEF domain-containing protein [Rhodanobacter sp.]|nr:MAG: GGDEF domain-containing protein [Rhodanobacter sp.]